GTPRLGGELRPIHQVAAIGRQAHALARLHIGRTGLGVLTCHAADAYHRSLVKQSFDLLGDAVGLAVDEALGATPALEQEAFAALARGEPLAQILDFP